MAEYRYDGLFRRIVKRTYDDGVLDETRHYYYSAAWQVIEERVGSATTADRQFVWGVGYIDELVLRDRGSERLYALQDANFNVTALADSTGAVVERFSYDAYGQPTVMDGSFGSRAASSYDWEVRYAGYRWDGESGLYQQRFRYLHPVLGKWVNRDLLKYVDGMSLYEYARSAPLDLLDPLGLETLAEAIEEVKAIIGILPFNLESLTLHNMLIDCLGEMARRLGEWSCKLPEDLQASLLREIQKYRELLDAIETQKQELIARVRAREALDWAEQQDRKQPDPMEMFETLAVKLPDMAAELLLEQDQSPAVEAIQGRLRRIRDICGSYLKAKD